MIDQFVADANARGLPPVALQATTFDGKRVKTDQRGWYIRQNHGLAIGVNGQFYVLVVPGGWRQRFTGVKLQPTQPSLTIGKGGRDGETGELKDFLARTLAGEVPQH